MHGVEILGCYVGVRFQKHIVVPFSKELAGILRVVFSQRFPAFKTVPLDFGNHILGNAVVAKESAVCSIEQIPITCPEGSRCNPAGTKQTSPRCPREGPPGGHAG